MLVIHCGAHFQAAHAHAAKLGGRALSTFNDCIFRFADDDQKVMQLWADHGFQLQHSFSFSVSRVQARDTDLIRMAYWYNGGIIYDTGSQTWGSHT